MGPLNLLQVDWTLPPPRRSQLHSPLERASARLPPRTGWGWGGTCDDFLGVASESLQDPLSSLDADPPSLSPGWRYVGKKEACCSKLCGVIHTFWCTLGFLPVGGSTDSPQAGGWTWRLSAGSCPASFPGSPHPSASGDWAGDSSI